MVKLKIRRGIILLNNKGYTILETIIAMSIFSIVLFSATNILIYTSNITTKIYVKYELQQNAQIAMEFLTTHISMAQAIELKTDENNTLDKLWLYTNIGTANEHITTFNYDVNSKRNWLMFGGRQPGANIDVTQELARYIYNIEMVIDEKKKLLHITITTDTTTQNTTVVLDSPIILNTTVDLRYKYIK